MIVLWLDDAVQDLEALKEYIAQDKPSAAASTAKRILEAVEILASQPAMGRPGRIKNTRELIVAGTPYLIPYRIKHHQLEILRVFHAAMEWPDHL